MYMFFIYIYIIYIYIWGEEGNFSICMYIYVYSLRHLDQLISDSQINRIQEQRFLPRMMNVHLPNDRKCVRVIQFL